MNKFNWTKAVGFGLLIWGIMAVSLWILNGIPGVGTLAAHSIVAGIGGIAAYFFARNSNAENGTWAAAYGLSWSAITLLADFVITQRFDAHVFASWQYWLGIALVFLLPWVQTELRSESRENRQVVNL